MDVVRLYLDSAEIDEIRDAVSTGLVGGIATNPQKIARSGKSYRAVLDEIRQIFAGPIAFQALGRTVEEIAAHARQIHQMDPLLAVKVTANKAGLTAVKQLAAEGVRTNATLIFTASQGLLAGLAGSPFISPFVGRAFMAGQDAMETIAAIRRMYDALSTDTIIIGASIKDVQQATAAIQAGAHSVAVPFAVFEAMMAHPLTEQGLEAFLDDFGAAPRE